MKIQIPTYFILLICIFSPLSTIWGQEKEIRINTYVLSVYVDDLPAESEERIIQTASNIFRDYVRAADLWDEQFDEVTQGSIEQFKELFGQNTQIVNDLAENFVLNNYNDYAADISEYLTGQGVDFDMPAVALMILRYDEAGYYIIEAKAEKTVYNGLGIDNLPLPRCKTGRLYMLDFTISIPENNLDYGEIIEISGTLKRGCEDANLFLGFGARYGLDIGGTKFTPSTFYKNELMNSNGQVSGLGFEHNIKRAISAGVNFQVPITKRELLFLNVGAYYGNNILEGSINGQYLKENDQIGIEGINDVATMGENGANYSGQKFISIDKGFEEISIQTLEILIGVRLRKSFRNFNEFAFVGDILVVPSLSLSSSSELKVDNVIYSGLFDSDGISDNAQQVPFPDPNDEDGIDEQLERWGFGKRSNIKNKPTIESTFNISLRISPGIQYQFNEKLLGELSVDYSLGITSFLNHEKHLVKNSDSDPMPGDSELKYKYFLEDERDNLNIMDLQEELSRSFMERYFDSDQISTLGIRIGILMFL